MDGDDGSTALCIAIRQENYDCAVALIHGGADVNINGGGIFASPLHAAAVRVHLGLADALVKRGAKLNVRDQFGNSPLHLLMNRFSKNVEKGKQILELLVSRNTDLNIANYNHWCPVHIAVRNGQHDAIKAIIKYNKRAVRLSLEHHEEKLKLNEFDLDVEGGTKQWSPLHLAALSRQL